MPIELSLSAAELDDEALQDLTRQLCRDLRAEAGVEAALVTRPAEPGTKSGEIELIGNLLIKALGAGFGGGGAVALFNVLKTYLQRKPTLEIEIQRKGGDKIKIKADDLSKGERSEALQMLNQLLEGKAAEEK